MPGVVNCGIVRDVLAAMSRGDERTHGCGPGAREDDVARLVADEERTHHARVGGFDTSTIDTLSER